MTASSFVTRDCIVSPLCWMIRILRTYSTWSPRLEPQFFAVYKLLLIRANILAISIGKSVAIAFLLLPFFGTWIIGHCNLCILSFINPGVHYLGKQFTVGSVSSLVWETHQSNTFEPIESKYFLSSALNLLLSRTSVFALASLWHWTENIFWGFDRQSVTEKCEKSG
jgi:hypothetical protein